MKKFKGREGIAIAFVVALILLYVGYQCYSVTNIGLQTQTATTTTIYECIDAEAIIIRDEQVIKNSGSAITVPALSNGDKVNVGGNVAVTFDSSDSANAYSKYNEIQQQLAYYESLESQTVGQAANVESINGKIDDYVDQYIRGIYNHKDVEPFAENLNGALVQRQMIIGEQIDFSTVTQDLRKQAETYASASKAAGYIKTDVSGVFSSYTDGFEDYISYDKAEEQTIDSVKKAIKKLSSSSEKQNDNIGKLITSYNWYIEMIVPADKVVDLRNGQNVTVALKDNDDTMLNVEIVDGAEPDMGAKETLLILKCNDMNAQLASLRLEEIELRYKTYEGIKVPMEALHVSGDKKGVYALISSQVRFRSADVIYSEDDWVLLSYDKDSEDGIRLYDKIIIQGKDLEDGKVYT